MILNGWELEIVSRGADKVQGVNLYRKPVVQRDDPLIWIRLGRRPLNLGEYLCLI